MATPSTAEHFSKVAAEWHNSLQKQSILKVIEQKFLTSETLQIDSAVCLGLGNLEPMFSEGLDELQKYKPRTYRIGTSPEKIPESWEDEIPSDSGEEPDVAKAEKTNASKNLSRVCRNRAQYQLLIFEVVLECLGFVQNIPREKIYFQDPAFSKADVEFLEGRGYTVLPYTRSFEPQEFNSRADPKMLEMVTSSTFVFAVALDWPVLVDVVCSSRPGLLLCEDPLQILHHPTLRTPDSVLETFENVICSCQSTPVPKTGYESLGFTCPMDLNDEQSMSRFQIRQSKAEEMKVKRREFTAMCRANRAWNMG